VIVIDTNVLSALMRQTPDLPVVEWMDAQAAESVWITSITILEARFGLALLAKGRRRRALETAFDRLMTDDLEGRVLDFDRPAAEAAALLAAARRRRGQSIDMRDTQIAGIVLTRRAKLATRNVGHFADLQADVIDPWKAP